MCGISGIISAKNTSLEQPLNSMVATQWHRGPDGQGTYFDKLDPFYRIGLGHNRLAILDLSEHSKNRLSAMTEILHFLIAVKSTTFRSSQPN